MDINTELILGKSENDLVLQQMASLLLPGERVYSNAPRLIPGEHDSEAMDASAQGIYNQLSGQTDRFSSVRIIDQAFKPTGEPLATDQTIVVIDNPQYKPSI